MAEEERRRFANLRSVRWRVNLGILPASPEASVDELRRAAADSRRRYVSLKRRLMVDPHLPKEEDRSSNLVVDNPLSQNPDSSWGRFFRGAELEKTVDQDLSRLYPEDGSYFQTPNCQSMLRRILLMWCLQHPECGYRQGKKHFTYVVDSI
jgi:TBC1 domain family protein 5